jgi:hypothetical protein
MFMLAAEALLSQGVIRLVHSKFTDILGIDMH